MSINDRITLKERIGNKENIYICGLTFDYCVIDTAITARRNGNSNVWIIIDLTRAVYLPSKGFITKLNEILEKLKKYQIKLCLSKDLML